MKRILRIVGWVVATVVALSCVGSFGAMWLVALPVQLAAGWLFFLARVLPEVSVRPAAVVEAVLVIAALGVGLHLFMRWLWPQLGAQEPGTRAWPVRWSVSILSLLVLLFLSTMATVGIGHHVGWLASGRAPLLESSFGFGFKEYRDAAQLCEEALRLSKGGMAEEHIGGTLLAKAETRELMEKLTVLPQRKPGSEVVFLVIPRDPVILQESGFVRCGVSLPGDKQRSLQATLLPRLLAGEELADDQGP